MARDMTRAGLANLGYCGVPQALDRQESRLG